MPRVCRHYEHQDFAGLLAELQNTDAKIVKPQSAPESPKLVEKNEIITPEARKRASLLSNPKMKYAYSQVDNTIHDRECEVLKTVQDKDFRMLTYFDTSRPICKRCYRKAIIRSGLGDDVKFINAYVRFFNRLKAGANDLRELIIDNCARLSAIDLDRVVITVHDDRWMICFASNKPLLYHNNYTVVDGYNRLFHNGYHIQNDGGNHTFHNFVRMMVSYSWDEHVVRLKAKALAELRETLRNRLVAISNWIRIPKFSLLNDYYTIVDCNFRLGSSIRKNGMKFVVVNKHPVSEASYRLVTCRVRKWHRKKFRAAMDALKEYSVVSGYYDYADVCECETQSLS